MDDVIQVGDHVQIRLDAKFGEREGLYNGIVVRIDPYSEHRNFYWVLLDEDARAALNVREISVFNPRNIQKTTSNNRR